MKGRLFVGLLVSLSLSLYLYKPLPSSVQQPWAARAFLLAMKAIDDTAWLGDCLGFGPWPNNTRALQDFLASWLMVPSLPDGMTVTDADFDNVPVRLYLPSAPKKNAPLTGGLVFYHGGGWVFGSVHSYDMLSVALAIRVGVPVVSVGYRLAPEVRFPVPLDDCVTATVHFFKNANKYNVNHKRIAIMGDSAGGNLAAAVALKLRGNKVLGLPPVAQVLIYPILQAFDLQLPAILDNDGVAYGSARGIARHLLLYAGESQDLIEYLVWNNHTTAATKDRYADVFHPDLLPEEYRQASKKSRNPVKDGCPEVAKRLEKFVLNPYFAPLMATDLETGGQALPEAYILTTELDVLRDDGILYAKKLTKAGVKVQLVDYKGGYHGFFMQFDGPLQTELGKRAFEDVVIYLKQKLVSNS